MSADTTTKAAPGLLRRLWSRLPDRVDRRVIAAAWATLAVQIGIVATGGLVRLTGSGLGCPTWPQCTEGSLVATPEMGIHGVIEFGNRLLTFVLVVVAIVMFLFVVRMRAERRDLFWLSLGIGLYVPLQAVIGGITVLVDLHPAIVGGHLLISMALVAFSAWLVVRTREGDGPAVPLVDRSTRLLVRVLTALTAVVLVLGVVVTGAGPHSGDDEVGYRFDVDPWAMSKLHAASVWAFVAVLVVVLVLLHRRGVSGRPWTTGLVLLAVTLAQGAIGYVQLFTGLPIGLVNLHMLGAALLATAVTFFVGSLRTRDAL